MPTEPEQEQDQSQGETPGNWEDYLDAQPETIKSLYNTHSEALMNTVRATRQERDALAKEVKELAKAQTEGSEARKKLDEFSGRLEEAERRANFMESAPSAQCKNPKAAWLLAKAGEHFDKAGRPDWTTIKAEAPELFGVVATKSNAGTGTDKTPSGKNMNEFIRKAAGRS